MEILGMKVMLPAVVKYRMDSGLLDTVLCRFDPATGEVVIDDDLVDNKSELQKLIGKFVISKRVKSIIPPMPAEGFDKLKPETYMNNMQD